MLEAPSVTIGEKLIKEKDILLWTRRASLLLPQPFLGGTTHLSLTLENLGLLHGEELGSVLTYPVMLVRITEDDLKMLEEKQKENTKEQTSSSSQSSKNENQYLRGSKHQTQTNESSENKSDKRTWQSQDLNQKEQF